MSDKFHITLGKYKLFCQGLNMSQNNENNSFRHLAKCKLNYQIHGPMKTVHSYYNNFQSEKKQV